MLVKICGLTRQIDATQAESLGVNFCGFIFAKKSPRYIDPYKSGEIKTGQMKRIGVFVEQEISEILEISQIARLDFFQLHGNRAYDWFEEACSKLGKEKIIKVLWPQKFSDKSQLLNEIEKFENKCAYYLMDAGNYASAGGTGACLNWEELREIIFPNPWFLAGGINPENIIQSIQQCSPNGVDINSGIEIAPGIKDAHKMYKILNIINYYPKIQ